MVGATVKEKGLNVLLQILDGIFMLEVQEKNALLDISYIGFKSQQLKVQKGGKAFISYFERRF